MPVPSRRTLHPLVLALAVMANLPATAAADGPTFTARLDSKWALYASNNVFWDLGARIGAPTDTLDANFGESWLEPGFDVTAPYAGGSVYGGLSLGASGTWRTDPLGYRDHSVVALENALVGWRNAPAEGGWGFDVSAGQQDYAVGNGMLLRMGAGNGAERGGTMLAPRTAWEIAGIARASRGPLALHAYFLQPNELDSNDTRTRLWGVLGEYKPAQAQRYGATYFKVTNSEQVYPRADRPLEFIERGRDGLEVLHGWAEFNPAPQAAPFLGLRFEGALQRNDDIDLHAEGVSAEVSWLFAARRFTPKVSYSWSRLSGDDPSTTRYERFDPMYYGGSLDTWWFGANSAFALINSNFRVHRLSALLVASPRDFVKLQLLDFRADELRSPLQFGQITRLEFGDGGLNLFSGVTEPHLTTEAYAEWTRMLAPNLALTGVLSWARPGDGFESVRPGSGDLRDWTTIGMVLSWSLPARTAP
jgi:hypothetical protein